MRDAVRGRTEIRAMRDDRRTWHVRGCEQVGPWRLLNDDGPAYDTRWRRKRLLHLGPLNVSVEVLQIVLCLFTTWNKVLRVDEKTTFVNRRRGALLQVAVKVRIAELLALTADFWAHYRVQDGCLCIAASQR
jgi:hypothetical protein